jgi:hypothetical protein
MNAHLRLAVLATVSLIAFLALMTQPSAATTNPDAVAFRSTSELAGQCKLLIQMLDRVGPDVPENVTVGRKEWEEGMRCVSYIEGALGAYYSASEWVPKSAGFCLPAGVTGDQIPKIFVRFSDEHPEYLHVTASRIVLLAVHDVFPCKSAK